MHDKPQGDLVQPISTCYAKLWSASEVTPDVFEFLNEHANAPIKDRAEVVLVDQVQRSLKNVAAIASEEYFKQCPDLSSDHEVKLDIVYGEFRSSQNAGRPIEHDTFFDRFPEMRVELTRQLEVAGWLRDETIAVDNMQTRDAADEETLSFVLPASADRKSDPQAPLSFDDFELKDVLGRGGMGTVFRATQISLGKTVAIKILRGGSDGEQGNVPRFLKEARAVAQLRHSNIVGVHGIGRDPDGRYFIVMDLVEGGSLRERIEGRSTSVDESIDVVADAAEAIEHAHRKGFLHRDLKPGNILLDESGTPMVTDFGLVKRIATTDPSSVSISGEIVGTPNYMAPEQADSRIGKVGPAADVYGLGGLLYSMLTGRPPYEGDTVLEVITQVVSDCPPRPLNEQRDDIPREVEAICVKCLERDPGKRYQTAAEVAGALRLLQGRSVQSSSTTKSEQRRVPGVSRRSVTWLCAVAAIVVIGIAVGLLLRPGKPVPDADPASPAALPPTSTKPVDVEWSVDAFLGGSQSDRIRLTDQPSPLSNGDHVRIGVEFSRSTYAYLFWIGSDASVSLLYPQRLDDQEPITRLAVPADEDKGLPVFGPNGSELIVLVLSDSPLPETRLLEDKLTPRDNPAMLPANSILVDGRMQMTAPSEKALAIIGSRLDKGSRSVGMPTRLQKDGASNWYAKWHAAIPKELGDVYYLAIPHTTLDER